MSLRRHRRAAFVALCVLVLLGPRVVRAAGFDLPENGAVPLARGGTAASGAGTAYALQFNPAGLSWVEGLDVRLEGRLVQNEVAFTRQETARRSFDEVHNAAGAFFAPAVSVAYRPMGLLDGRLSLGAGVWGPPGVGRYAYPDPIAVAKSASDADEVDVATGQRYGLIDQDLLIVFPSVGFAWRFSHRFAGVTLQNAVTRIDWRQSIAALSAGGTESSALDAVVRLKVSQAWNPTAIVGLSWKAGEHLQVGASLRPQLAIRTSGTIETVLPEVAGAEGISLEGDRAELSFNLPMWARLGATWSQARWSASAELVYEGWSAMDRMSLSPDVRLHVGSAPAQTLAPIVIEKHWRDTLSGRVGGSWTAIGRADGAPLVELHAGALYEPNAIPTTYQSIDFVTGERLGLSAGLTAHVGHFSATFGALAYRTVSFQVQDSLVARAAAEVEKTPVIVGNGSYQSAAYVLGLGLAYASRTVSAPSPLSP